MPSHAQRCLTRKHQQGMSLMEFTVSSAIGLLTAAAAMTALIHIRSLSQAIHETVQIQQQAAYAFRVIGQQIRQAGSLALRPVSSAATATELETPFAWLESAPVSGTDAPGSSEFALSLIYQDVFESTYAAKADKYENQALLRNCLGEKPKNQQPAQLTSRFKITNGNLVCAGTATAQIVLPGVTDLHILYLVRGAQGNPLHFQYLKASEVQESSAWPRVQAIEICLEITGSLPMPASADVYIKCDGSQAVRAKHLKKVFKNNFHIPSSSWNIFH